MAEKIQLRTGTASAWTTADPTLLSGEMGIESDTRRSKVGDGSTAWSNLLYWQYPKVSTKSADFTVADADSDVFEVTTAATDRTATLPTLADNTGRIIRIIKVDSGAGKVTIDGEGAETIDGNTTLDIFGQGSVLTVRAGSSEWDILEYKGARPVTNAVRVVAEYLYTEDNELDYTTHVADGTTGTLVTFSELPENTVKALAYIACADTGTEPSMTYKRSSGGTHEIVFGHQFADVGTNKSRGTEWLLTGGNAIYVTDLQCNSTAGFSFDILGYQVGEST